ncbi:Coiled-coil domain-containing protein 22 [Phytophthora nicotianae]|uniref:Coiled-coil domain-containing protein 22 n=1 Tax=Phytophthora nicotianae TaxID=4792 RepID=A0A0W8DJ51_PHYNI|nr:Coiled-coil domain-containing protein 22 [Phytophthora nicotianae]
MGLFKVLANALGLKKTQVRILVVGLDNSGKTTLVNHLKPKKNSTDTIRMCVAKDELEQLVEHKELSSKKVPILFFANKMDLPNSLTPVECMQHLELDSLGSKSWHITASNAVTGRGVEEGIEWLADQFAKGKSRK